MGWTLIMIGSGIGSREMGAEDTLRQRGGGEGVGDRGGGGEEGAGLCLPSNLLYIDITSNVNLANITIYKRRNHTFLGEAQQASEYKTARDQNGSCYSSTELPFSKRVAK